MAKFTVKQVADYLNLSPSGVHRWVDKYGVEGADVLSPGASNTSGDTGRLFDENDVILLWTVKVLRDQNTAHDDIIEMVQSGHRYDPPFMPQDKPDTPAIPRSEIAILQQTIGEKNALIDHLRDDLKQAHSVIDQLKGEVSALERMMERLFDKSKGD